MTNKVIAIILFATFAVAETKPSFVQKDVEMLKKENRVGYARPFAWGIAEYQKDDSSPVSVRMTYVAQSNSDGTFSIHLDGIIPEEVHNAFRHRKGDHTSLVMFRDKQTWIILGNEWIRDRDICSALTYRCNNHLALITMMVKAQEKIRNFRFILKSRLE